MRSGKLRLLSVLLAFVAGCGGEEPPKRDNWSEVYERTMRAVHAADWAALSKELTKDARFTLEKDLKLLARRLGHPEDGKATRRARARPAVRGTLPM